MKWLLVALFLMLAYANYHTWATGKENLRKCQQAQLRMFQQENPNWTVWCTTGGLVEAFKEPKR